MLQSSNFEKNLLSDKVSLYQESLNRVQNEYMKKSEQADEK